MKDLKRSREDDDAEDNTEQLALPKACGFTKQDLMGLLEKANYDASAAAYKAYFFKNRDASLYEFTVRGDIKGHVDRCLRCGLCIDEHNPAAAAGHQPLPPAPCAVPTVFVTLTTNLGGAARIGADVR